MQRNTAACILDRIVTDQQTIDRQLLAALEALAIGDADCAARYFSAVLALDPANNEALHGRVRALRDAGRLAEAVEAAVELTTRTPADALAFTALSITLQHAGRIEEAEAARGRARVLEWKQQLSTSL